MGSARRISSSFMFIFLVINLVRSEDFYSFSVENAGGEEISLEQYRGKVTLVVNVASFCGFTESTYRSLKKLHDILSYGGQFSVLAFPCNQFGDQEPADAPDIVEAMTQEYGVEFPIFNKIQVVGEDASPAFRNLIEQSSIVPDWNFYKYLVNGEGKVLNAWGTRTTIEHIFDDVEAAIKLKKIEDTTNTPSDTQTKKDEL